MKTLEKPSLFKPQKLPIRQALSTCCLVFVPTIRKEGLRLGLIESVFLLNVPPCTGLICMTSDRQQPARSLLHCDGLGHLPPAKLLGITTGGLHANELAAGGLLFREGDRQSSLFILAGGLVQLSILVPGRGDVPILTVGPGELIAWSAVLFKQPMTCTARALEDSKLLEFPVESIEEMVDRDPQFAKEFYRWIALGLSQRLTATRLQLLDLFQHPNA